MDALLWVLFAANTLAYRHIGRTVISQPAHQRPRWAWSRGALEACGMGPPLVYIALTIAAFVFGDDAITGVVMLAASVAAFVIFAVRPDRNLMK